jgi:hypothetical protein
MNTNNFELLDFQKEAVTKTIEAIYSYDRKKNTFSTSNQIPAILKGKPKPYLHRIKAVTGAGQPHVVQLLNKLQII